MGVLTDLIDQQLAALSDERARILTQAKANVAEVDVKLSALTQSRKALTPEVENAYLALKALGLTKDL